MTKEEIEKYIADFDLLRESGDLKAGNHSEDISGMVLYHKYLTFQEFVDFGRVILQEHIKLIKLINQ